MNFILKIFIISVGLLSFNINTALAQQLYTNREYYEIMKERDAIRPKSKFKFRKKRHVSKIDLSKIDTNAIYLTKHCDSSQSFYKFFNYLTRRSDSSFTFLRFFKDAVFESGPYKTKPDEQEVENLDYGVWRCYTMTRKGLLVIQIPKRLEMDSKWIHYFGNILTDKIEFVHYKMPYPGFASDPIPFQEPKIYSKQPVNFKNRKYQWRFTHPEERNGSVTLLRDCTGTYIRWQGKDYRVCNIKKVASFPDGSAMTATFKSIDYEECNGAAKDEIVCTMLHISEGWVEIIKTTHHKRKHGK